MHKRTPTIIGIAAVALAATAQADEKAASVERTAATPAVSAFAGAKALDAAELGEQRAKAKIELDKLTIISPEQNGVVAGNSAVNTTTGANSIADTAFAGAAGIVNTIQNTGNNVLIQSSTIVNVALEP
jgi:hypothetical protein